MPKIEKRVLACERCGRQKKKCVRTPGSDACLNCSRIGAPCSRAPGNPRWSSSDGSHYVELLQETLRAVQKDLGHAESSVIGRPAAPPNHNNQPVKRLNHTEGTADSLFTSQTVSRFWRPMCDRIVSDDKHLAFLERLAGGAELPFPLTFAIEPTTYGLPSDLDSRASMSHMPSNVTEKLFQVYIEKILPQSPIFSPAEVHSIHHNVRNRMLGASAAHGPDIFLPCMIMAVATMTSNADDRHRIMLVSEGFFKEAMHTENHSTILAATNTRSLQALLLLAQYAMFAPHAVDIWHVASEAMRVALELGLHEEPSRVSQLDDETINARRRLFWATYSLERSIALTCHRPFSIRNDQINLHNLPPNLAQNHQITFGSPAEVGRYVQNLEYCWLQTEICSINVTNQTIRPSTMTYPEWMDSCEKKIRENPSYSWSETILIPDFDGLPAWRCLAWLFMPCPRNPKPNASTVEKFVNAILHMIKLYWRATHNKSSLRLCWMSVHHAYEIGIQLLFCMQTYPDIVRSCCADGPLLDALAHVSYFLSVMKERWSGSLKCKSLFDKMKKGVTQSFLRRDDSELSHIHHEEEDMRLVDIILRKNGEYYFSADKSLNLFSYVSSVLPYGGSIPSEQSQGGSQSELTLDMLDSEPGWIDDIGTFLSSFDPTGTTGNVDLTDFMASIEQPSPKEHTRELSPSTQGLLDTCTKALDHLPVCTLCRSKRIKCSRSLPNCDNCVDFGESCTYVDSATGEVFKGSHIWSLRKEIETLIKSSEPEPQNATTGSNLSGDGLELPQISSENPGSSYGSLADRGLLVSAGSRSDSSTCYFGKTSIFGKLVVSPTFNTLQIGQKYDYKLPNNSSLLILHHGLLRSSEELPRATAFQLAQNYYHRVETLCPILGKTLTFDIFRSLYDSLFIGGTLSIKYQQAYFNLILAISLASSLENRSSMMPLSATYFNRALANLSYKKRGIFSASSIDSLRLALLMCFYVWLDPSSGNISRLLNAACRICLDLFESQDLDEQETNIRHTLFRTTYVLDTIVATSFGRPNHLPEWRRLEKMQPGVGTDSHELSFLLYEMAGLQSRIHQESLSLQNAEYPEADITHLTTRLSDWLVEWNAAASKLTPRTPTIGIEEVRPNTDEQRLQCYGSFFHGRALFLLRDLAKSKGLKIDTISNGSVVGTSWIEIYEKLLSFPTLPNSPVPPSYIEFPVIWTHYYELFGTGLELFDPYFQLVMGSERRKELMEKCGALLKTLEIILGNQDWTLSEQFNCLVQNTFGGTEGRLV